MRFAMTHNKDAGEGYRLALIEAGYEHSRLGEADFLFVESSSRGKNRAVREMFMKEKPGFIYPHTPRSYFIWDGPYRPLPAKCHFVSGEGSKIGLEGFSYKTPVEVVGFTRCEVKQFKQTHGRNLLFVPARPRKDEGKQHKRTIRALDFIIKNRDEFDTVLVNHTDEEYKEECRNHKINYLITDPRKIKRPAAEMVERVQGFDIVISCTSPACLSVASGVPTIFYGEGIAPETLAGGKVNNYKKYKRIYDYPLNLEDMTIDDVLNARNYNDRVEVWKSLNIGSGFDKEKFIDAVRRYL